MLSEGVQLYFSLVKVIGAAADPHIKLFYCLGWGKVQFHVLLTKMCNYYSDYITEIGVFAVHTLLSFTFVVVVVVLGLPALIVAVSLAATQGRGYANMQTCWLSTRNHVLWAFVAPALLIVSVSFGC